MSKEKEELNELLDELENYVESFIAIDEEIIGRMPKLAERDLSEIKQRYLQLLDPVNMIYIREKSGD